MKVYNNIDCIQIQLKEGQTDYYLPQNTNWKGRVIDRIMVDYSNWYAPITAKEVLKGGHGEIYITLFDTDNKQIMRDVAIEQLNIHNNNEIYIGREISANLSYLSIDEKVVEEYAEQVILLYFFYGTKDIEYSRITRSVTLELSLNPLEEVSLQKVIENYIALQPANVKGVIAWTQDWYLTLREENNRRTLNYIPSAFMFPQQLEFGSYGAGTNNRIIYPFRLDNLNIDMYNSYITNSTDEGMIAKITFLY